MTVDSAVISSLCERHDIRRLRIFGSAARGDDTPTSDVDLLADFSAPKSLFDLVEIEDAFSEVFGRDVDLVTEAGLSQHIRPYVLADARVIYERAA